jgi:hypothetical protein
VGRCRARIKLLEVASSGVRLLIVALGTLWWCWCVGVGVGWGGGVGGCVLSAAPLLVSTAPHFWVIPVAITVLIVTQRTRSMS